MAKDPTDLEVLRMSEARLRALVDSIKDHAIFMLDPTGHVLTWNAGAERIKGWTPAEIVGKHFSVVYTPEDRARRRPEQLLGIAAAEGRVEDEAWRVRKDGTRFWADVVISAIRDSDGKITGFSKVTRDLSERRIAEEERLRLAQAQEAVRLRDEFLSIASHELRTPLTALRLQIQSMRGRLEQLDDKVASRIDRAERSSERLATLVDALLDVSRIATGRFSLTPARMDLGDLVHDVVDTFREQSAGANCTVSVEVKGPAVGNWDRMRIEQVVTNLLTNALKYAAGKPVRFTVGTEAGEAVLSIEDHGPGIPSGDLERIFGRFERAASFRHYGGLGLGLYVAREIVEAHGGSVSAENRPGGGARFVVRLPLTRAERLAPPAEELH